MMNDKTESVHLRSVKNQVFGAVVVNLLGVGYGLLEGWSSPSIILLTSDKSPLASGKISMDEASWAASLLSIGALFGNLFFGYIINIFGRKIPAIIITLPVIVCWFLVLFAQNVHYLFAARLLSGFFGGGGYLIVGLFLSEISSDRIRGALISTMVFSEDFGILLASTVGHFFGYSGIPKLAIATLICLAVLMCFFPETPVFLMKQGKIAKAEKSVRFYHNISRSDDDCKLLAIEIDKLKRTIDDGKPEKGNTKSVRLSDFTKGVGRKAMLIGIFLMGINQLTGIIALSGYSTIVFEEAGSNLSPTMSTIIIGIIQLLGTCVATSLVDRCGRRLLLLTSTIGASLGLIVLGIYMMLKSWNINVETVNWIPITSFSFIMFISSLGILSLPLTIVPEIMPEKIKDSAVSFCMICLSIFAFIGIKFLPSFFDAFGFHGAMFIFAGICLCGTLFVIFVLPETKGKSHEEIMQALEQVAYL